MLAQIYEQVIHIPTYELKTSDKHPMMTQDYNPYPYRFQNHIADKKQDHAYQAVILENQYLQLTILPELGGRVYRGVDKRTEQTFIYTNEVIKPRVIGKRGAFFAGGIEFNFPISHAPTTMSPVPYELKTAERWQRFYRFRSYRTAIIYALAGGADALC